MHRIMILILNTSFPTLNEYINLERTNKILAAKLKKKTTNKIAFLATLYKFSLPEKTCFDVKITWFKPNNKHDHDNISFGLKFILDGLIYANILENDTPRFINNICHNFELDKTRNYISCNIEFKPVN